MNWLEFLEQTPHYARIRREINAKLVTFLKKYALFDQRNLIVAELACGTAVGSDLLAASKNITSIALDRCPQMYTRETHTKPHASFVLGDLVAPPFKSESFDLVWSSSSLEHFPDRGVILNTMAELVRPGGYLFVGVPNKFGPLALYFLTPRKSWREWIGRPMSARELDGLLADIKFQHCVTIKYFFGCFIGTLARKLS